MAKGEGVAEYSTYAANSDKRTAAAAVDAMAVTFALLAAGAVMKKLGVDVGAFALFGCLYFLYNCAFLARRDGRTLGKAAMDICVISSQGRPVALREAVLRASIRACPFGVMALPGLRATAAGLILFGVLLAFEVTLLERLPARLTIADRVAGTLVVNTPPLQPQRAPAAPMYSEADAEFGFPPKRPSERPIKWTK